MSDKTLIFRPMNEHERRRFQHPAGAGPRPRWSKERAAEAQASHMGAAHAGEKKPVQGCAACTDLERRVSEAK